MDPKATRCIHILRRLGPGCVLPTSSQSEEAFIKLLECSQILVKQHYCIFGTWKTVYRLAAKLPTLPRGHSSQANRCIHIDFQLTILVLSHIYSLLKTSLTSPIRVMHPLMLRPPDETLLCPPMTYAPPSLTLRYSQCPSGTPKYGPERRQLTPGCVLQPYHGVKGTEARANELTFIPPTFSAVTRASLATAHKALWLPILLKPHFSRNESRARCDCMVFLMLVISRVYSCSATVVLSRA
jgi:hypothetical protein